MAIMSINARKGIEGPDTPRMHSQREPDFFLEGEVMATKKETAEVQIVQVQRGKVSVCILGTTPLILNRMSQKVLNELLLPKGKKTAADKATSLKHDPYQEFLDSPYLDPDDKGPTYLTHLATAFKKSLSGAAVDIPGASRAQMGRLSWVEGERIPIYGIPEMFMAVTRSADMNRTPDVRTRAIVRKWACQITISFVKPHLNEVSIVNLLVSAGMTQGVGDWRTEKGSGTYGSFEIVSADNPDFKHLLKTGGRKAQKAAMEKPGYYDRETEELFSYFRDEVKRRGKEDMLSDASPSSSERPAKTAS